MKRLLGIVGVVLMLTAVSRAQNANLQDLLAGKEVPLTLKLKDLTAEWRRFSASGATDPAAAYLAMMGRGGNSAAGVYFTKGQTATVGGETYLVAYRIQAKPIDLVALQNSLGRGNPPPVPERPKLQSLLSLALLNLRSIGSLMDVQPFNLEFELTGDEAATVTEEEKRDQEINNSSLVNLRKVGTALILYERERKVLPTLTDAKTAQSELELYVSGKNVFTHPQTKEPYQPNPALSGKRLGVIAKPEKTIVFYEAQPAADGSRGVLFVDGHAERVAEALWPKLKQAMSSL